MCTCDVTDWLHAPLLAACTDALAACLDGSQSVPWDCAQRVERLRASLLCTSATAAQPSTSGRQHLVFVDGEEEAAAFRPEDFFDTPADLLGRRFNRPRHAQLHRPDAMLGVAGAAGIAKRAER